MEPTNNAHGNSNQRVVREQGCTRPSADMNSLPGRTRCKRSSKIYVGKAVASWTR